MYGFWRLGLSPFPSAGAAIVSNGLETATRSQVKPTAIPPSTGVTHTTRSRARFRANQHRERGVAGEDEQPEEQRALLPAPERRDLVLQRQRLARVPRDVGEREVVADEARDEDERRDERREERGEERVPRGVREPALAAPARPPPARDERVDREPEGDEERRAAELGHVLGRVSAAWYFDGHFVIIDPGVVTKSPSGRCVPVTTTSRPVRKRSGTDPL